ncbi:MAG TPA: hypothetical protein VLA61_04945 [Ideonella sp.]|uniref:hypothetical protein n=1 Tax=Ideonella sp. TaxID=1929293 RepID=UPI002D168D3C|nr:hypothetical protein [Ideonella sp.]HSI47590.1 hypothetical protein [Ideonella sp.]
MTRSLLPLLPLWLSACLFTGCAGTGLFERSPQGPGAAHGMAGQALAPQAALDLLSVGSSRKAEVSAALGPAIVIPFDSGDAVWVYRWPGADRTPRAATELVLLFDASGLLTKARLRPGHPGV